MNQSIFRREGEYWTVAYAGAVSRLRDAKGLYYLALLLRHPNKRFAATDLLRQAGALNGNAGDTSPDLEQARSAVTKRIKAAIQKIRVHHPTLGYYLSATIKTGYVCAHLPGPEGPIEWEG